MRFDYELIVVAYKSRRQLGGLLADLPDVPLAVVDNSATEEDLSDLLEWRSNARHLDTGGNVGFSVAANLGAQTSSAPNLIFLNPDTRPSIEVLEDLVGQLRSDPGAAAAAPNLTKPGGQPASGGGGDLTLIRTLLHAAGLHRVFRRAGVYFLPRQGEVVEADWLSGTCLAIRRDLFLELGGFDPYYFIYASDLDLGRKIRQRGLRQWLRADLAVPHLDGGSSEEVPASSTWRMRGRGWAKYIRRNRAPLEGAVMVPALVGGFLARAVLYRALGRRLRSQEVLTYARSIWEEYRRPNGSRPAEQER